MRKAINHRKEETPEEAPGRRKTEALTELETEIMQVVWGRETATAAEVREALLPRRPLALTTVITVLERLRQKDMVRPVPTIERSRRYRARVPKETIADNLLTGLLRRFFNNSPASLMAHLMQREAMDEAELSAIRRLITDSHKEGGEK